MNLREELVNVLDNIGSPKPRSEPTLNDLLNNSEHIGNRKFWVDESEDPPKIDSSVFIHNGGDLHCDSRYRAPGTTIQGQLVYLSDKLAVVRMADNKQSLIRLDVTGDYS